MTTIFGDAFCVIAHALEVCDDAQHRDDFAQVRCHRLLQRYEVNASFLNFPSLFVD